MHFDTCRCGDKIELGFADMGERARTAAGPVSIASCNARNSDCEIDWATAAQRRLQDDHRDDREIRDLLARFLDQARLSGRGGGRPARHAQGSPTTIDLVHQIRVRARCAALRAESSIHLIC